MARRKDAEAPDIAPREERSRRCKIHVEGILHLDGTICGPINAGVTDYWWSVEISTDRLLPNDFVVKAEDIQAAVKGLNIERGPGSCENIATQIRHGVSSLNPRIVSITIRVSPDPIGKTRWVEEYTEY